MITSTQISDIWLMFSEHIDRSQLETLAEQYIELLLDSGVSEQVLSKINGIDVVLEQAIDQFLDLEQDSVDEIDELDF